MDSAEIRVMPARTREELKAKLKECAEPPGYDIEERHELADQALLEFINDPEITTLFDSIIKWYA